MLKLVAPGVAEWADLGPGVRALVCPGTSITEQAARALAAERVAFALKGGEVLAEFGIESGIEDLAGRHGMLLGLSELLAAVELGDMLIEEWEGLGDEQGEPVAPSRQWIARLFLMHPGCRAAFWRAAFRHRYAEEAEGNGFAPPLNGSPAAAPTTAGDAGKRARPALRDGAASTGSSAR